MKKLNIIIFLVSFSFVTYLVSCGNEDVITPIDDAQITADSLAQSIVDNDSIDWYIESNNLEALTDSIFVDSSTGVRFAVLEAGTGQEANLNDIVSVHYIGRFLTEQLFDTSHRNLALLTDSLSYTAAYAQNDTTFQDIFTYSNKTYEEILDSLTLSDGRINNVIFSITREYSPITFNYTENASGITGFINGFRVGLNGLMNIARTTTDKQVFELGGKAVIFIPSAAGYGLIGNILDPTLEDNIPPNTPLIFEFEMVNIRN